MGGIGKVVLESRGALAGSVGGFGGSEPCSGGAWTCNCGTDGGTGGGGFCTRIELELPGIIVACPCKLEFCMNPDCLFELSTGKPTSFPG
uniref:Uncharacterized protein n=1 Tax=Arundo donax TaxID=35708 RepID=A0A0A9H3X8_ARUDO